MHCTVVEKGKEVKLKSLKFATISGKGFVEGETQMGFVVNITDLVHFPAKSVSHSRSPGIVQKGA